MKTPEPNRIDPPEPNGGAPDKITFFGGTWVVLVPLMVFLLFAIYLFVFKQAFDMFGLAMGGFLGIVAGALLCRNWNQYWNGVIEGVSSSLSGTVVTILLASGIFSAMMKTAGVADGLVWFGSTTGITGAFFCAFTFAASAIIATATGSSIGTIFTAVPIFFSAGVLLGADPSMLAGAVLSGAIFGDNLAPVSDVTVISASTQKYRQKTGVADIGGVVASRSKYALVAALMVLPVYMFAGGTTNAGILATSTNLGSPAGLIMLLPVALLIYVAIRTQNVFSALVSGSLCGCLIGLLAGRFTLDAVFMVSEGKISGFLYGGITNMAGTILLCLTLFGVAGVFERSGSLQAMTQWLQNNKMTQTARGTELTIGLGAMLCSFAFAGVTSAALILFGPVGDKIGATKGIHPYRRANIMSGLVNSLPVIMPFSAFVFIVMAATGNQDGGASVTPFTLFYSTLYPWALFLVFLVCMLTGLGRRYEGVNGEPTKIPLTQTPTGAPTDAQ